MSRKSRRSTAKSATRRPRKKPRSTRRNPVGGKTRGRPSRRESGEARRGRATIVYKGLAAEYPDAKCALDHRNAFELIVATILSAQCTDRRVNLVTPVLFAKYPNAAALAEADRGDVEQIIQSTGFFRAKAKSLVGMARSLVEQHGGEVPARMESLVKLRGVGRKTANVVLGNAFGINDGVVVDTHVGRLSKRLGFTRATDPVKIEQDLMPLFQRERWTMLAHLLISHGRAICIARKPKCGDCVVAEYCPSREV